MSNILNKTIFRFTLLVLILVELVSFFGYLLPAFGTTAFIIVLLTVLAATLRRLEVGLYAVFAELVMGSKGYLLSLPIGSIDLSLRMGLFLVVMAVWLGQFLLQKEVRKQCFSFFATTLGKAYLFFGVAIFWGIVRGFVLQQGFSGIFFDVNNYLYGVLLLPLITVYQKPRFIERMMGIITAATTILALKVLWLVLWFSHPVWYWWEPVYRWVRITGVGEITQLVGGVSRIFLQSQIFHLVGFFMVVSIVVLHKLPKKQTRLLWLFGGLMAASLFASGSRSFWVGIVVGLAFAFLLPFFITNGQLYKPSIIKSFKFFGASLIIGVFGIVLAWFVAVVPIPGLGFGSFDLSILAERAATFTGEAGVASRWSLLTPLGHEIKKATVLGQGFGATVTYTSQDPRVLATHPDGLYTTSAFEWGYLDMWLKMGIVGLLALTWLFWVLGKEWLKIASQNNLVYSFGIGMIALAVTHAFSPYLNHPLGIGLLLLFTFIILPLNVNQQILDNRE